MTTRKGIFVGAFLVAALPNLANAAPSERHIPRGELQPQVIEKVYDSPRGEVQFTVIEGMQPAGHSGYLRNVKGNLMGFTEVRGGGECEKWFLSSKEEELPRGCEFLFYDNFDGRYMAIRSDEMEESSLFEVASEELRGKRLNTWGLAGGSDVSL
jgi:hypothetical protein